MKFGVAIVVVVIGACGDNEAQQTDAGVDDATVDDDAAIDATPDTPPSGFTIGGASTGIRTAVVLTLTTGADTRHVVVNDDGAFQFPGRVPPGASYAVTTADATCNVIAGSGTNVAADVSTVQLRCGGVVELASVSFASGSAQVPFTSTLTPAFDPGAYTYVGTRPFFMDDTDMVSVTPVAAYPTLPSITVYTDPTASGQRSPAHVIGSSVPVRLQHPTALDQTYQFTLKPGKPAQTAMLTAPSPVASDLFGTVALSGDVLVVGAPNRGGTGAAFVLRRGTTGWTQEQVLQPTADVGAAAGTSVAINGDVLVIGVPSDVADNSGRAYVYRYNGTSGIWALDAGGILAATTPAADASCGASVAISGARIIIGCPAEKGSGNKVSVGAVYMFRYDATVSAWVADGTFKGANASDQFGSAVALSGTTAVVGAPYEDNGTTPDTGAVYVLVRGASSWSQQGTTLRGDATANARFGSSVAISGNDAIVGAVGEGTGSAYVFHRVGTIWSLDGPKLVPSLATPEIAKFGAAVAIDGTHALVGAWLEDAAAPNSGAVHAYRRETSGWTTSQVVTASNPTVSRFGASVALDGEWIAVGAPDESTFVGAAGAVYVFR